jgi:hypothetical protein
MMSWEGLRECERWKAAKERPIVPVPINVIRRSWLLSTHRMTSDGAQVELDMSVVTVFFPPI